jgi:hypothetical protein
MLMCSFQQAGGTWLKSMPNFCCHHRPEKHLAGRALSVLVTDLMGVEGSTGCPQAAVKHPRQHKSCQQQPGWQLHGSSHRPVTRGRLRGRALAGGACGRSDYLVSALTHQDCAFSSARVCVQCKQMQGAQNGVVFADEQAS